MEKIKAGYGELGNVKVDDKNKESILIRNIIILLKIRYNY